MFFKAEMLQRIEALEEADEIRNQELGRQAKRLRKLEDQVNELNLEVTGYSSNPFYSGSVGSISSNLRKARIDLAVLKAHFCLKIDQKPIRKNSHKVKDLNTGAVFEVEI